MVQHTKLLSVDAASSRPRESTGEQELEDRLDNETIVAHRYRILRFAGNRGFGQVYQAEDSATDESVSLMRLDREFSRPGVRDRFFATRGSARIDHAGAVDLTDYGEDLDGRLFLVMPWIERAEALDEVLGRERRLPWTRARSIAEQIAEALQAAHRCGILHGGLEPSRVLIDDQGRAHVLDFGLAPALESSATTNANKPTPQVTDTRVLAGKPAYMPPELVRGDSPTERSDIYALGLLLWELLAGRPPFFGNPVDTLHSQLHDPLPELIRGDAPAEVEALLHIALAKEPDDRFSSVEELLATLRGLPGMTGTSAQPAPAPALPKTPIVAVPVVAAADTAPAPQRKPTPASPTRGRRFGLLERAIVGFLLFDVAMFGAWKLLGNHGQSNAAASPVARASEDATPDELAPAPAPASTPRVTAPPTEQPIAAPAPPPASLAPALPIVPIAELPKQLGDADFRKTMVDAREQIAARCLDDQRLRRTLKVSLDVTPGGQVEQAKIVGALATTALGKCVARQTRQLEFPPSLEGGSHVYSLRLR